MSAQQRTSKDAELHARLQEQSAQVHSRRIAPSSGDSDDSDTSSRESTSSEWMPGEHEVIPVSAQNLKHVLYNIGESTESETVTSTSSSSLGVQEDIIQARQAQLRAQLSALGTGLAASAAREAVGAYAENRKDLPRAEMTPETMKVLEKAMLEMKKLDLTESSAGTGPAPVFAFSVGSEEHAEGKCFPCFHNSRPGGCRNGVSCRFCHLQHADQNKKTRHRPCKYTRSQCKQVLSEIQDALRDDEEQKRLVYEELANYNLYMRSLLKNYMDESGHTKDVPVMEEFLTMGGSSSTDIATSSVNQSPKPKQKPAAGSGTKPYQKRESAGKQQPKPRTPGLQTVETPEMELKQKSPAKSKERKNKLTTLSL